MELVKVSYLYSGSLNFGKHRKLVAEEVHRPVVAGAGTCSLPAGLIDDPKIECQFILINNYYSAS